MDYKYRVTLKVFFMLAVSIVGIPAFFVYGGSLELALLFTLYGIVTNALAQIAYHRWLCHDQFVPNFLARYAMIFSTVISGNGNHIHYVYSHLNHHKNSDTDKDTHNPIELGYFKMWLGHYNTPTDYISMRNVLKKRDVVFASKHYWKLYSLITVVHFLINPWLVIWQAFNFTHAWIGLNWLNFAAHDENGPRKIRGFTNMWMLGEGNHDVHHKNSKQLDTTSDGLTDWAGKYIIPWVLAK